MKYILLGISLLLAACGGGKPADITPVQPFNADRYLGKWYEIARFDHRFERGLSQVTAEYSLRDDGGIRVVNRGFSTEKNKWKESDAKAYFVDGRDKAFLKVSFWGPFYSSYIVIALDEENYQYALVTGENKDYLWILARQPDLDPAIYDQLVEKAKSLGFATEKLLKVDHQSSNPAP